MRRRGVELVAAAINKSVDTVERAIRGRWRLHDPALVQVIADTLGVNVIWLVQGGYRRADMPMVGSQAAVIMAGHGEAILQLLEIRDHGTRWIDDQEDEEIWIPYHAMQSMMPLPMIPSRISAHQSGSGRRMSISLHGIVTGSVVHEARAGVKKSSSVAGVYFNLDRVVSITRVAVSKLSAFTAWLDANEIEWIVHGPARPVAMQIARAGGGHLINSDLVGNQEELPFPTDGEP